VLDVSVDVLRTDTVLLQLTAASTALQRDHQHLMVGVKLFFDLAITASLTTYAEQQDQYADYQLKVSYSSTVRRLEIFYYAIKR